MTHGGGAIPLQPYEKRIKRNVFQNVSKLVRNTPRREGANLTIVKFEKEDTINVRIRILQNQYSTAEY